MPFRTAHEIIGRMVLCCIGRGCAIEDLSLDELRGFSAEFHEDVFGAISLEACVAGRKLPGGPAREAVMKHIEWMENRYMNFLP